MSYGKLCANKLERCLYIHLKGKFDCKLVKYSDSSSLLKQWYWHLTVIFPTLELEYIEYRLYKVVFNWKILNLYLIRGLCAQTGCETLFYPCYKWQNTVCKSFVLLDIVWCILMWSFMFEIWSSFPHTLHRCAILKCTFLLLGSIIEVIFSDAIWAIFISVLKV